MSWQDEQENQTPTCASCQAPLWFVGALCSDCEYERERDGLVFDRLNGDSAAVGGTLWEER